MQHNDWLEWRRKGIGSSDAPIICGVSPWSTPYRLWEIKTGRVIEEETGNWATRRGHELEPIARADYELRYGFDMPPTLAVHASLPFLRASLDGYRKGRILEIKCPGKDDHELALGGKIPEKYYPQVQHQMLVTGEEAVDYLSFYENQTALVTVSRDDSFIASYMKTAIDFWALVENDIAPSLTEKDFKSIRIKGLKDAFKKGIPVLDIRSTYGISEERFRCGEYLVNQNHLYSH